MQQRFAFALLRRMTKSLERTHEVESRTDSKFQHSLINARSTRDLQSDLQGENQMIRKFRLLMATLVGAAVAVALSDLGRTTVGQYIGGE